MSAARQIPVHFSLQEFLSWAPGDGRRYELVDGQPRVMAPTSPVHGVLQAELGRRIGNHLGDRNRRCRVVANPGVVPKLLSAHNFRVPNLGVTCSPILPGQTMLELPVLLVEVLSFSNQADTWSNVWTYTTIPSVQEILILHTMRIAAELLRRTRDGSWPSEPETIRAGNVELASIGFSVSLADLYEGTGLTE